MFSESQNLDIDECGKIFNHRDWITSFENSKLIYQLLSKNYLSEKRWTHPLDDCGFELLDKWILTSRDPYKRITIPAYSFTELLPVFKALGETIQINNNLKDAIGWMLKNYYDLFDVFVSDDNNYDEKVDDKLKEILNKVYNIQMKKNIFNPRS